MDDVEEKYGKHLEQRAKHRLGLIAFVVGLAMGFIFAERFYLYQNMSAGKLPPWYSGDSEPTTPRIQLDDIQPVQVAKPALVAPEKPTSSVPGRTEVIPAQGSGRKAAHSYQDLPDLLQSVAPSKEVMIAISDYNLVREGMLTTWIECVKKAGVHNYMVVGLDEEIYKHLQGQGVPVYYSNRKIASAQQGTGSNHAISALKFGIIKEFLNLGWSVLLSDVDIVTVQDPFKHLYRDSDVEGMSDGFDERTAYGFVDGFDDPTMGWARYAQAMKHFNFNSGLFYLRANDRTVELMQRLEDRLSRQKYWDQTAYNEEIFFLSHGSYTSPQVSVRVMDIYKFMNSKTLFKFVRKKPRAQQTKPVMVHINYHPNKHERMLGVIKYYLHGDNHALDRFPGGSEPGTRRA